MRFLIGFVSFFIGKENDFEEKIDFFSFCFRKGISTLVDAAQECYSCDRNGCNDNFNANNPGVVVVTAPDGWCLVSQIEKFDR